jgi:hypothetical protein
MITNIHPADELHDIRTRIKALEEREAKLRAKLLTGECSLVGDSYVAKLIELDQQRLDLAAARKALGKMLASFTTTRRVRQVRLSVRSEDV